MAREKEPELYCFWLMCWHASLFRTTLERTVFAFFCFRALEWFLSRTCFYPSTQFNLSKLSPARISTCQTSSAFSAVAQSSSVSLGWSGVDHNGCIFQGVLSLPCTKMFSNQVKARAFFFHQNHFWWEETQAQILQMTQFILNEASVCNFSFCKETCWVAEEVMSASKDKTWSS